ncbi:hypothetical protein AWENTII_003063 [Aspergillus wentii]|nr:hypothetical protein MW887_007182 [Aspergillus wentii]
MASYLPIEIVSQIASYLAKECGEERSTPWFYYGQIPRLTPCSTVSSTWQAACEPFIYRTLLVYSEDLGYKGHLTWHGLDQLTSGAPYRRRRRAWIRHILYQAVVPWDNFGESRYFKLEGYTYDNPLRRGNDEVFHLAVANFFDVLASWGRDLEPRVCVTLLDPKGVRCLPEPLTFDDPDGVVHPRPIHFDPPNDAVVIPQSLGFPPGSSLAQVPCINTVHFEGTVKRLKYSFFSSKVASEILASCPYVKHSTLRLVYPVPNDSPVLLCEQREANSNLVAQMPSTLETLNIECGSSMSPFNAPNLLPPSGIDSLLPNLRMLSMRLRELRLKNSRVSSELFWPSQQSKAPYWPRLEIFILETMPLLPSGDRLISVAYYAENPTLDEFNHDALSRIYIALGRAVHQMPRLQRLMLKMTDSSTHYLNLNVKKVDGVDYIRVEWSSSHGYRPDYSIYSVWGIPVDELHVSEVPGSIYKLHTICRGYAPVPRVTR